MIKRLGLMCLLLLLGIQGAFAQFDPTHARWNDLLHNHVVVLRGGQTSEVDYAGFTADRTSLQAYLASTSKVTRIEFDRWSNPMQLAFLINAYNAWTVELVLTGYGQDFENGWRGANTLGRFLALYSGPAKSGKP